MENSVNKKRPGGRPNKFKPEYIEQARKLCKFGHTDPELAEFFGVHLQTINNWKAEISGAFVRPKGRQRGSERQR
jgi:hypothetical protein